MSKYQTEKLIKSIGEPIFKNIMKANSAGDYSQLAKDFSDSMKVGLPIEKFKEAQEEFLNSLGEVISMEYLCYLNKVRNYQLLWKVQYKNSDEEVLWQLFLGDIDTNPKVEGLLFG